MKKVLITGANSYIGTSFERYALDRYPAEFVIDTLDMTDPAWQKKDFGGYDIIFHVAGIAHADTGKASEETKQKYYSVNRDLAVETAKKAKAAGVKQFVFMSSAIIYGSAEYIDKDTEPKPLNFYGDSKWQADKAVRELAEDNFTVTVLRPPMIYGRGSKGNFPTLKKLALKLPCFPDYDNTRSMLHVENLCEFLVQVMVRNDGGIFFPQNAEYVRTSDMVKQIAKASNKPIIVTKALNPLVSLAKHLPGKPGKLAGKAFGNCAYDKALSEYGFEYRVTDFATSVERSL